MVKYFCGVSKPLWVTFVCHIANSRMDSFIVVMPNVCSAVDCDPTPTGDVAQCYADLNCSDEVLRWKTGLDIDRIFEDTWQFATNEL